MSDLLKGYKMTPIERHSKDDLQKMIKIEEQIASDHRKYYNELIDKFISELQELKLTKTQVDGSVLYLQELRGKYTVLTSSKRRKEIEKAFEKLYDSITYRYELLKDLNELENGR